MTEYLCPVCGRSGEMMAEAENNLRACMNTRCRVNEFIIA